MMMNRMYRQLQEHVNGQECKQQEAKVTQMMNRMYSMYRDFYHLMPQT
jgi:hypothetical protein